MKISEKLYFSPHVKFADLDWNEPGKLIDAIEDRVLGFYLEPAEKLGNAGDGFALGLLCATTIDFVARIETGGDASGSRIRKWLCTYISAFGRVVPAIGKTYADLFYGNFRNGLVHEGRVKNLGQFSFDETDVVSMKDGVMLVNPRLLLIKIRSVFLDYCEKLRNDRDSFERFRRNLIRDFGEEVKLAKRFAGTF